MPGRMSVSKMNFTELFSLKGRMRRKHFAIAFLVAAVLLGAIFVAWPLTHIKAIILSRYLVLAAFVPPSVRRLHDINLSGWFAIIAFVMPLAFLPLLVLPGIPGENKYGPDPIPHRPEED